MAVDRQMIARTVTFGEGPYLQAYAQDRAVAVEDLATAPAWVRLNAVVGQLHVCGS